MKYFVFFYVVFIIHLSIFKTHLLKNNHKSQSKPNNQRRAAQQHLRNLDEHLFQYFNHQTYFTLQFSNFPHAEHISQQNTRLQKK